MHCKIFQTKCCFQANPFSQNNIQDAADAGADKMQIEPSKGNDMTDDIVKVTIYPSELLLY